MSERDKPLPKPPGTPFGRQKRFDEENEQGSLLADRMAAAAAEGRLEEFLEQEMPESEQARSLARMMLGMTGMMPAGAPPQQREHAEEESSTSGKTDTMEMPDEVRNAAMGGDVQGLMDLLRREHLKRTGGTEQSELAKTDVSAPKQGDQPAIDKTLIDALVKIASDNSVSLDWIILRAIKVYVEEYRKTGKL